MKELDPLAPQFDMPALISQRLHVTKQHATVPDASDALATMKYWDEYRRKERARIAELTLEVETYGGTKTGLLLTPGGLAKVGLTIGEMPTTTLLTEREITNHLEEIHRNGARPDMLLLTPECALENGVIGVWRFRWLKFKQKLGGLLNRNEFSGVRSVPPPRGTAPKN